MAPPTTTRDFAKRPRAKVGKRAPARINATDTSFRTASVAVASQERSLDKNRKDGAATAAAAARAELASSRGNALSTLQASLRHHAPAVRASGLKGIRDAVQSLSALESSLGTSILEANLPSLLPNACRCWLDEDDDVRSLAINLFGDILRNLSSSPERADLACLAPFVPFLVAHASSALNGLEHSARRDGAAIVGMLASSDPSPSFSTLSAASSSSEREAGGGISLSAMSMETGKHVDLLLPPLERSLSSLTLGGRGGSGAASRGVGGGGAKKRRRDGNVAAASRTGAATLAAKDPALLSLPLLLCASMSSGDGGAPGAEIDSGIGRRRLDPSLYVPGESSFLKGGSAQSNSLLLFRGDERGRDSRKAIRGILDLPAMPLDDLEGDVEDSPEEEAGAVQNSDRSGSDALTLDRVRRMSSLLETLRMKLVELTHSGRKSEKDGLNMSSGDLETIDVLVQTVRFVHRRCLSFHSSEERSQLLKQAKENTVVGKRQPRRIGKKKVGAVSQDIGQCLAEYQTTVAKTLSLLLESFPIHPMDGVSSSRYELTNAGICAALAELGGDNTLKDDRSSSSQWIDCVFSYILPRLNSTNVTDDGSVEKANDGTGGNATNMLLKVVSKLLLPHSFQLDDSGRQTQSYLLGNPLKRHELLVAFAGAFFPQLPFPPTFEGKDQSACVIYTSSTSPDAEQRIQQLALTAMGKTAARLLTTLITQSADRLLDPPTDDTRELHEKNSALLLQMTSVLPIYLASWEAGLPVETGVVLASFISIIRQWSESTYEIDSAGTPMKSALNYLCLGLRPSLEVLYLNKKREPSIFERLPEQVQKLCIGLIGLLKCPSSALSKSLSIICSKSFALSKMPSNSEENYAISKNMANYIMEVMHSLRKTMPMPTYITFLIDSCGMGRVANTSMLLDSTGTQDGDLTTDPLFQSVFFYDGSIGQLSRFLTSTCDHASAKVVPMIRPLLQKWLSTSSASTNIDATKQLIQSRGAISIIAAFAWDEKLSQNSVETSDFNALELAKLDETFDQLLMESIIDQLELSAKLWSMTGGGYMDNMTTQQRYLARLMGPITLLLRYRHGLFGRFLDAITTEVIGQSQKAQREAPDATPKQDDTASSSRKINVAEVHMKAFLLVLRSRDPVSMVDLIRSSEELQNKLVTATEDMEKVVSGGHLAHLGSKLSHQAKMIRQ